ncbi:MAG: beta-N-acetylhexosaminidase [Rhodospirillales bacterium]|nr:beta-N-acetylhexosaminidase [Rhodospirillales bacterium]
MLGFNNEIPSPVIFGCIGTELTSAEIDLFQDCRPFGLILFEHNCKNPTQLSELIFQFRETVGFRDAAVLIDQEGGRVTRMKPPHWRLPPAAGVFSKIFEKNEDIALRAAYLNARLIGKELANVKISVNCLPVLDLPELGSHDVIGDRALGKDVRTISLLGGILCRGLMEEGVSPIIKHIPGHGRAKVDSHRELPLVDTSLQELKSTDFIPFRNLCHIPWAMTAHVVYSAIDKNRAATISPIVINEVVRNQIGFEGLLLSDDIGMEALSGSKGDRAQYILEAGCDLVLECSGKIKDMVDVASVLPAMKKETRNRAELAEKNRIENIVNDGLLKQEALREFDQILTDFLS